MTARLACSLALLLGACAAPPPSSPPAPPPPGAADGAVAPTAVPTPDRFREFGSDPTPAGSFVFFEDFEHGYDRWELPDAGAEVAFRKLNAPTCGGLWTVLLGRADHQPYTPTPGEHVLALKAPLDLSKARRPFFKYDVKGVTFPEAAVALTAEIRAADGVWRAIGRPIKGGYVFMASIGADLTAYAGQRIDLRFRATLAAGSEPSRGMYLDDIQVIEPSP